MKGQGCRRTGQILEAMSLRGVRELAGDSRRTGLSDSPSRRG